MDIISVVASVLRRWYVSVPIVLLFLGLAGIVESRVPPQFTADGALLLSEPELDPSRLPLARDDLEQVLEDVRVRAGEGELTRGDAELVVQISGRSSVEVTAMGPSESSARSAVEAVTEAVTEALRDLQESKGVPEREWTTVAPSEAQVDVEEGGSSARVAATLELRDPTADVLNPFGATAQTARVLEVALQSDQGQASLTRVAGHEIEFALYQRDRDVAPIVEVVTKGISASRALEDFDHVVAALGRELDARQARALVPETRRVVLEVIAAPQQVEDVSPPVSRVAAGIAGLGGLLALGSSLIIESLAWRRRRAWELDVFLSGDSEDVEDDPDSATADPPVVAAPQAGSFGDRDGERGARNREATPDNSPPGAAQQEERVSDEPAATARGGPSRREACGVPDTPATAPFGPVHSGNGARGVVSRSEASATSTTPDTGVQRQSVRDLDEPPQPTEPVRRSFERPNGYAPATASSAPRSTRHRGEPAQASDEGAPRLWELDVSPRARLREGIKALERFRRDLPPLAVDQTTLRLEIGAVTLAPDASTIDEGRGPSTDRNP